MTCRTSALALCGAALVVAAAVAACTTRASVASVQAPGEVDVQQNGANGGVNVFWAAVPGASGYRVRIWENVFSGTPDSIEATATTLYADSAPAGTDLWFEIAAIVGGADGPFTAPVHVVPRGGKTIADAPIVTIAGTPGSAFGAALATGDADGDGLDDLLVGAPGALSGGGAAMLYAGRRTGLAPAPLWTTSDQNSSAQLGTAVALGDLDRDGVADIAVGVPSTGGGGEIRAFKGGPAPSGTVTWSDVNFTGEGAALAACHADLDGDGFPDLAAGAPRETQDGNDQEGDTGILDLNLGTLNYTVDHLGGASNLFFGSAVACTSGALAGGAPKAKNSNGQIQWYDPSANQWHVVDGTSGGFAFGSALTYGRFFSPNELDLAASLPGGPGPGSVEFLVGGAKKLTLLGHVVDAAYPDTSRFGTALARFPDHDPQSPGVEALAVGLPGAGTAAIIRVNEDGSATLYDTVQQPGSTTFGSALAVGDFNGDGYPDLAIGDPGANAGAGSVTVYLGAPAAGPLVTIGGALAFTTGSPLQLLGATYVDEATRQLHQCTIDWGDGKTTSIEPCAPSDLAAAQHAYAPSSTPKRFDVTVTVIAIDGRTGQSTTTALEAPSVP